MAKNISLLGADYPDVPAVQLPQTGGGTATFYDINVIDNLNSTSATDALSANQGRILKSPAEASTNAELLTVLSGMGDNETKTLTIYGNLGTEAIGWNGRSSGFVSKTAASRWEIVVYSSNQQIMIVAEVNTSTGALENIRKFIPQLFQTKDYSYNYSVGAGQGMAISASDLGISTPPGYKPVAIVNINTANDNVLPRGFRCDNETGNVAWIRNIINSNTTGTLYMSILYQFVG